MFGSEDDEGWDGTVPHLQVFGTEIGGMGSSLEGNIPSRCGMTLSHQNGRTDMSHFHLSSLSLDHSELRPQFPLAAFPLPTLSSAAHTIGCCRWCMRRGQLQHPCCPWPDGPHHRHPMLVGGRRRRSGTSPSIYFGDGSIPNMEGIFPLGDGSLPPTFKQTV